MYVMWYAYTYYVPGVQINQSQHPLYYIFTYHRGEVPCEKCDEEERDPFS